ncbi:hypothetical protein KTQ42_02685|uniref:hypothetical protein n=1 Tax=Noviherbaspirillum sp. L7-7A TaxID=2850560 RepID=UPI001C2BAA1A|nr:hypothetical protein [Noviherbaspirillum sp. L7-7A]MBV0878211.1 hypothetical protein [Noviherbaspirillum sp. L7-7A]
MQFKEQGGKVQVLLYTGFDEARNAPIVRIVGSFDKYTYKPSPGLLDKLSLEQRDELDAECNRRRQAALALNRQHYINSLAANIRGACDSLDNNAALTAQQSDEIWDAMADLVRAMREAGYPRPSRDRKPGAEAGQGSLFD